MRLEIKGRSNNAGDNPVGKAAAVPESRSAGSKARSAMVSARRNRDAALIADQDEGIRTGTFMRSFAKVFTGASARQKAYLKIASMIENSISLTNAMKEVYDRASDEGKKKTESSAIMLREWYDRVLAGRDLDQAVEGWATPQEQVMIGAGAKSGKLSEVLHDVVAFQSGISKMKSAIWSAMAYPALLMTATILVLQNFSTDVIPAFAQALPKERWTGAAAAMAIVADFVENYLTLVVAIMVTATVAAFVSLPRWTGAGRAKFDMLPPWSIYRTLQGCSFMLSLSMLLKAGVQMPKALDQLAKMASPYLKSRITAALNNVYSGADLGSALHQSGHNFPSKDLVDDLRTYSRLSNLDAFMIKVSRSMLDESVKRIQSQMSALNTICMLFLGVTVLLIAAAVVNLNQQVAASL